jgi:hypothetical protein
VSRADINSISKAEDEDQVADKSYRFASAYRDVVSKRDRARKRAAEVMNGSSA